MKYKILLFTNLFPNSIEKTRGTFVMNEVLELTKLTDIKVVAPVVWSPPFISRISPKWSYQQNIPVKEVVNGIEVYHPRHIQFPKVGRFLYGFLMFLGTIKTIRKIYKEFEFDLIYAHYVYPDGVAAGLHASSMKVPFILKVRGSDVNIYGKKFLRKFQVQKTLNNCRRVIAVSNALAEELNDFKFDKQKIEICRNGVHSKLFCPLDKKACRKELSLALDKKYILYIGNFQRVKGVHILLEAFKKLILEKPDTNLLLIGGGELLGDYSNFIKNNSLDKVVKIIQRQPQSKVPIWINASDVLCLPSLNEGYPNILMEAISCHAAIVAAAVGGVPEIANCSGLTNSLFPSGDSISLLNKLTLALRNNNLYTPKKKIEKTWREVAEHTVEIIKNMLS